MKQLVQKLEDKNPQDEKGVTPLHMAALTGHLQIVENSHEPRAGTESRSGWARAIQ